MLKQSVALAGLVALGALGYYYSQPERESQTNNESLPAESSAAPVDPVAGGSPEMTDSEMTDSEVKTPVEPSPESTAQAQPLTDFPTGSETPEGAACDLGRAFLSADSEMFLKVCMPTIGTSEASDAYQAFLDEMSGQMDAESKRETPSPNGPKRLLRVYHSRELTLNGPASFADVVLGGWQVQFVDVLTENHNGSTFSLRALVVRGKDGHWLVCPHPDAYPLLSAGLNDETSSTEVLFEVE